MSEEKDPPETAEPEESKPERRFSQEHYDRLMKGQEPWLGFRTDWKGEGDPWEAFEKDSPEDAAVIRDTVEAWNMDAPTPALLDGADLRWAHLAGADLKWAHLEGANLRFAHLEEAEFVTAHLEGASLVKAHLEGADLNKAILRGADMSRCDLKAANLANADLTDVIGLTAGQLAGADVTSATLPEDIKDFESLKVTDEAAKNSRSLFLNEADLFGADLSGANLFGADLRGANLNEAILGGANLNEADLFGADLSGANLFGADLSGADLSGANLFGANVTGVTGGSAAFWRRAAILAARCSDLDTGELTRFEAPTDGAAPEICRR